MDDLQNDIIKYKKGELSPKEMHALEKKALTDAFLAEALEGTENISAGNLSTDITELNQRILKQKKTILFTPLRIAAGVTLIAASVFVIYQLSPKHETIALKTKKEDTPVVAPKVEAQRQEKQSVHKKNEEAIKSVKGESEKSIASTSKGPREKAKATSVDHGDLAKVGELKTENQPSVAQVQALAAPEKKPDELKVEAKEQAPVSIAMEPVQEVARDEDLKKTDQAAARMKKAAYKSDAASGAGKVQITEKSISGKVVSADDGSPLPGVNVLIEGTNQGTVTDANGNFVLTSANQNQRLVFSFVGLQTQEVEIQGKDNVDVELKSDVSQLSEVVVTALGKKKDDNSEPVIHLANPAGGRRAYNKYLDTNVRYPEEALKNNIKGKVKVEFSVRTDGSLDDYEVVKSLGHGCDEEVIRLIKEGPKWSPTTENGAPVESRVRIGVKFDPAKSGR